MEAPIITERRGSSVAYYLMGFALIAVGALTNWVVFVIGAILLIVGEQSKGSARHYCGACGNDVSRTSMLCPACQATLYKAPMPTMRLLVMLGWFVTISLMVIGVIWMAQHQGH